MCLEKLTEFEICWIVISERQLDVKIGLLFLLTLAVASFSVGHCRPGFNVPPPIRHLALAAFLLSGAFQTWAMIVNPFFSPVVRIQTERGHHLIAKGPYASENEEIVLCNTCKSPACTSCGHWATIDWQRRRWCALPEGPYLGITLSMPDTLWTLFAANPHLTRELPNIAASAIMIYGRVYSGVDVGVMPIAHSFNGKMEFNSHVHTLVFAKDLQRPRQSRQKVFFKNPSCEAGNDRLLHYCVRHFKPAA